jgi:hypothetical protein
MNLGVCEGLSRVSWKLSSTVLRGERQRWLPTRPAKRNEQAAVLLRAS